MKKIIFACLCTFLPGFAILSPFHQSLREFKAMLNTEELTRLDQSYGISEIVKCSEGFLIFTETQILKVKINYISNDLCGPRQFTFEFSDLIQIEDSLELYKIIETPNIEDWYRFDEKESDNK